MKVTEAKELNGKRILLYAKLTDHIHKYVADVTIEPEKVIKIVDGEVKKVLKCNLILDNIILDNKPLINKRIRVSYKQLKQIYKYRILYQGEEI